MKAFVSAGTTTDRGEKMTCHTLWHTEVTGVLSSETRGFRLVVQKHEKTESTARFLIFRLGAGNGGEALVGSGTRENVQAAMDDAERIAGRCAELHFVPTRVLR
jgi:hypothetical protein